MVAASPQDQDFLLRAESCLREIQAALDAYDPDEIEADLGNGVLRISFADGKNCILNRQSAAHQIWLAEGASAWHFTFEPTSSTWVDTKGRGSLRKVLGEVLSRRLGRSIAV